MDFSYNHHWLKKFNLERVRWLEYAAYKCKAASVDELVDYLSSEKPDCSPHVVDFVLWQYGEDKALYMYEDEEKDARELFSHAWEYCEEFHPDELEWAMSVNKYTFKDMESKKFLRNYCWVVYTGNSRVGQFEEYFPELETAFKDFDITALSKMRSIKSVLNFFDEYIVTKPGPGDADFGDAGNQHEKKTKCFLAGAKMIANEGFETYKKRLQEEVKSNQFARRLGKEEKTDPLGKLLDMNGDRSDITRDTKSILESNLGLITDTIESDEDCFYDVSRHVVDFVLRRYSLDS